MHYSPSIRPAHRAESPGSWDPTRRPPPGLRLEVGVRAGVPVLSLAGRLDSDGVAAVEALLTEAQGCDRALVPCDLSDLGELTGDAVHRLLEVAAARPACPAPLVLCCVSGQPARMLAEVDPGGALPPDASVAEAVRARAACSRWAGAPP